MTHFTEPQQVIVWIASYKKSEKINAKAQARLADLFPVILDLGNSIAIESDNGKNTLFRDWRSFRACKTVKEQRKRKS